MEELLRQLFSQSHWTVLAIAIAGSLYLLGKGADWLVDEAVRLSQRSGIPKTVIGATIVSLGTTTPEAAVSVLAAVQGNPDLALGNAVGSIICDTGLILGLASLISPLRLDRHIVNRQGWIQVGAAAALVLFCAPWGNLWIAAQTGGTMPQWAGFVLIGALAVYLWQSVRWSAGVREERNGEPEGPDTPVWIIAGKLVGSIALVVGAAQVLIPAVDEAARRAQIPESVIAATLVAFGTSLPELVTAVTAARRGHGELAIGNVMGADILNVLFVAGVSAAATSGGLYAGPYFFVMLFPAMILILVVLRIGIFFSKEYLTASLGVILLVVYLLVTAGGYLVPSIH